MDKNETELQHCLSFGDNQNNTFPASMLECCKVISFFFSLSPFFLRILGTGIALQIEEIVRINAFQSAQIGPTLVSAKLEEYFVLQLHS